MAIKASHYVILFAALVNVCSANWNRQNHEHRDLAPNPSLGQTKGTDFSLSFAASEAEISELETEFNIKLNTLNGESMCEPGYKCVALLVDAGLREPRPDCDSLEDKACEYQCGILSNLKHHITVAKDYNQMYGRSTGVFYDVVLVHDFSITDSILAAVRNEGVRTLLISDSLKELICSGIERQEKLYNVHFKTPYSVGSKTCREAITFSQDYPFKLPQVLLVQAAKPVAFSLTYYQAATFLDTDAYIYSIANSTANLKWFMQQGDDVELFAGSGPKSPINAARWIGKPSLEITRDWLSALRSGFNNETGWEDYGPIPQVWEKSSPDTKGTWEFMGADRDQGLLWYIFGLKRKSLYHSPDTGYGQPFGLEYMVYHLSGKLNPWSSKYDVNSAKYEVNSATIAERVRTMMGHIAQATSPWKMDSSTLSLSEEVSNVEKFLHSCAMRIEENSKM